MLSFRDQYIQRGFCVLPNQLSAIELAAFRKVFSNAVNARATTLLRVPRPIEVLSANRSMKTPVNNGLQHKIKQMREKKAMMMARKRLKQGRVASSGDDIFSMAEKVASQLVDVEVTPSVKTDPSLLEAIEHCKVNVWMTDDDMEVMTKGLLATKVGNAVRDVVGIQTPMLFADRPLFRTPYCRPTLFHFGAPLMGIGAASLEADSACVALVFADDTAPLRCPLKVIEGFQDIVRAQYPRVPPRNFALDFSPVDSHIGLWLDHFPDVKGQAVVTDVAVSKGSIVLMNPYLFHALGPNYSPIPFVAHQLLVAERFSTPSRAPPSWVRQWKERTTSIDFRVESLFPAL